MEKELFEGLSAAGFAIVKEAQEIIRLNGAYKTGRLYKGFKIRVRQTPNGYQITISNDTPYAKYIDKGTYEWKNQEQSKNPVTRKYDAVNTGTNAYPFNRKGIEPIYFMDPVTVNIPKLTEILGTDLTEYYKTKIISEFKDELTKNK
jgi:hypothetical protein